MLQRFISYGSFFFKDQPNLYKIAERGFKYNKKSKLFYVHDYYSKSASPEKYKTDIYTRRVLMLKEKDPKAIKEYSEIIADFISTAIPNGMDYTIVCVPSADKDNKSCMEYCIETIRNNQDMVKNTTIHYKDYGLNLVRTDSIEKAHKVSFFDRPSSYIQLRTIGYNKSDVKQVGDAYVVLIDDIATTGTTINACKRRFMCNKIKKKRIIKLVMAQTVKRNTNR